jgi:gamma-glutamyltranspeptidase/glutathione hydrolase
LSILHSLAGKSAGGPGRDLIGGSIVFEWPSLVPRFHCDEVLSSGGLVTAPDPLVAAAGAEVLRAGGNAVDAAVAAAFAEGVAEPPMAGVGGGVTMTIALRDPDRTAVVEGHMVAPLEAGPEHYPIAERQPSATLAPGGWSVTFFNQPAVEGLVNVMGAKAIAVPGAVAALLEAHQRYGRLPRADVMRPAIGLAADGFRVNWFVAACAASDMPNLMRDPGCSEVFLPRGAPIRGALDRPAARLRQPRLARTLELIAAEGGDAFYRGAIGESIVRTVRELGGLLSMADLDAYRPIIREPAERVPYRSYELLGAATSGLSTVAASLHLYELGAASGRQGTGAARHDDAVAWARALKLAFEDRFRYMTADDTVSVPWDTLMSATYARARFDADEAGRQPPDPYSFAADAAPGAEPVGRHGASGHTSQISVVDADGNLVSMTATILADFGARVLDPETGVLLNNGMAYFDPTPGVVNGIRPGVQVLSAMSPTILVEHGRGPVAALGASGGRRIISGVAQIVAAVTRGMTLQDAIEQPRIYAESNDVLMETTWPRVAAEAVEAAGFNVVPVFEEPTTVHFARPNGVTIGSDGTRRSGVDPKKPGGAAVA